jgi:hypothetical protein
MEPIRYPIVNRQTVFGRSSLALPQLLPLADFGPVSIR